MTVNIRHIKLLIEKKGWSQNNFAARVGVSNATMSRVLSGKRGAGNCVISGIIKVFPNERIEELFFLD